LFKQSCSTIVGFASMFSPTNYMIFDSDICYYYKRNNNTNNNNNTLLPHNVIVIVYIIRTEILAHIIVTAVTITSVMRNSHRLWHIHDNTTI